MNDDIDAMIAQSIARFAELAEARAGVFRMEIREMAESARRSIAQRVRWMRVVRP